VTPNDVHETVLIFTMELCQSAQQRPLLLLLLEEESLCNIFCKPWGNQKSLRTAHTAGVDCLYCFAGVSEEFAVDLAAKVAWAEDNPERVASIVKAANAFARKYLSKQGQQCFAMQMLDRYSRMLKDVWQIRRLRHRAEHVGLLADTAVLIPSATTAL